MSIHATKPFVRFDREISTLGRGLGLDAHRRRLWCMATLGFEAHLLELALNAFAIHFDAV